MPKSFPITEDAEKQEYLYQNHGETVAIRMLEDFEDGPIRMPKGATYRAVVAKYDAHGDGKLAVSFLLDSGTIREFQTKIFTSRFEIVG